MQRFNFSWTVGEDRLFVFTAKTPTNISGWSITVTLYDRQGGNVLPAPSMVVTPTDVVNGVFTAPLSDADSTALGRTPGWLQVRRVDSGHNTVLVEGPVLTSP